jgi:hypothetical protein
VLQTADVALIGDHAQPTGDQEVTAIAISDLDDVPDVPQLRDILLKDDKHGYSFVIKV